MLMIRSFFNLEADRPQLVARHYPLAELDEVCDALDLVHAGNSTIEIQPSSLATTSCLNLDATTVGITATALGAIYSFSIAGQSEHLVTPPIPKAQLLLARATEFPVFLGFRPETHAPTNTQHRQASAHQAA